MSPQHLTVEIWARNWFNGFKHCCLLQPVCSLSGVGETEDGVEFHAQDEVEDKEGLFA